MSYPGPQEQPWDSHNNGLQNPAAGEYNPEDDVTQVRKVTTPLRASAVPGTWLDQGGSDGSGEPPRKKGFPLWVWLVSGGALLVVAAAVVVVIVLINSNNTPPPPVVASSSKPTTTTTAATKTSVPVTTSAAVTFQPQWDIAPPAGWKRSTASQPGTGSFVFENSNKTCSLQLKQTAMDPPARALRIPEATRTPLTRRLRRQSAPFRRKRTSSTRRWIRP